MKGFSVVSVDSHSVDHVLFSNKEAFVYPNDMKDMLFFNKMSYSLMEPTFPLNKGRDLCP